MKYQYKRFQKFQEKQRDGGDWMKEYAEETYRFESIHFLYTMEQAYKQMIPIMRKSKIKKIFTK